MHDRLGTSSWSKFIESPGFYRRTGWKRCSLNGYIKYARWNQLSYEAKEDSKDLIQQVNGFFREFGEAQAFFVERFRQALFEEKHKALQREGLARALRKEPQTLIEFQNQRKRRLII